MTDVSVYCNENIACGTTLKTAQAAVDYLAEADKPYSGQGHRRNMMAEEALYVGVGCYVENGAYYWVQMFGIRPTGEADGQHYADPVTITSLEENIAHMTGPEDLLMNLGESMALSEIRPVLTMPGHKLLYVRPLIPDMAWSSGDASVVEVSGNQLVARGVGRTTLTGTVGDLSVTAEIIVRESAPEFDVHIDGVVFYSDTEKVITVTIPEVADAVKYEVWFDRLGVGESKYYYEKTEPGEYYWKLLPETNGQPAHYVITAMAKDAENHVIASCERRALLYPTTGLMTLPGDLETLEAQAMAGTSPTCVVVPEGCSSIGAGAFSGCGDLASVRVPASVTSIAADAFSGCPAHMVIVAPAGSTASEAAESMGFKWFEFDD